MFALAVKVLAKSMVDDYNWAQRIANSVVGKSILDSMVDSRFIHESIQKFQGR